ncbi:MAG: hypothetical protein Q9191_006208 [Dirinaria sp. TL-2023a]
MDQLAVEEAISVLLQESNIHSPSAEDIEHARDIVLQFGCLPIAINQAGAYIRSRHKSLAAFKKLCQERRKDILDFKPRLAAYDQTVLTTWNMNFEQVERDSRDARILLLLFCYLEPADIPEAMLDRACTSQKRWDHRGEILEESPVSSGIDEEFVQLVKNELKFDDAIEVLQSFSLIYVNQDQKTGLRKFSIHPLVQYCASQRVSVEFREYWRLQAIALICHAFPRDDILEPFYFKAGIEQLPHVWRIHQEFMFLSETALDSTLLKRNMAALYLSASRFRTKTWKTECINQAKRLSQDINDQYLCMSVAERESSLLRMTGKGSQSDAVLIGFIGNDPSTKPETFRVDLRCNARLGKLIHSRAENLLDSGDLEAAQTQLLRWTPIDDHSPSSMEKTVQVSINVSLGRILKTQGQFQDALGLLGRTFQQIESEDVMAGGWRRVLFANLGDLYCEVGRPADAQAILIPELESMRLATSHNTSSGRRLQSVLAESYIRSGSYQRASKVLANVQRVIQNKRENDNITNRNLFRTWTMLARISEGQEEWEEALHCWNAALTVLRVLGKSPGPDVATLCFGIAFALLKCGQMQESAKVERQARSFVGAEKERMYQTTGLDSYWRDHVLEELAQK